MSLKPLSSIALPDFTSFNSSSLRDEIIARIKQHPDWNSLWDGDLYQTSFQMILLLYSYLFEKNIQAFNILLREKFLNQSFSPQAIYDNLSDMRIQLQQNTTAHVVVTITSDILVYNPIILPRFYKLTAKNKNNQNTTYELILYDESQGGYKYYDNIILFPNSSMRNHFTITAYSGSTQSAQYSITPQMFENFKIQIKNANIIENSIQAYFVSETNAPIQLINTETFIVEPKPYVGVFPNGIPHFIVRYNYDGSAELLFGNKTFGGAFDESHLNGYIEVFWRTGGGSASNILSHGIDQYDTFVSGNDTYTLHFYNEYDSSIAVDREDIYVAQQFAPYRYGRGKAIVDKIDAKSKLYMYTVKHEIDTPQYNDLNATVQLLHAYHYIVPKRDFTTFTIPYYNYMENESYNSYKTKFLNALNDFCNVQGSHDYNVKNEYVTNFVFPNTDNISTYSHLLKQRYPLSASLRAYAYDYANRIVDSIVWNSNYPVDEKLQGYSLSTPPTEHTIVYSNPFSIVIIINELTARNNIINVAFDKELYNHIFTIELLPRVYTYKELAEEIQRQIIQDIIANVPTMIHLQNHVFVEYEEIDQQLGRLKFVSPSVGEYSTIEFFDNGTPDSVTNPEYNIYLFLGVEKKVYRPLLETGLIFSTSQFKYENNVIDFVFRTDKNQVTKIIPFSDLGIIVDHSREKGPSFEYVLSGENKDQLEQLMDGTTCTIEALKNNVVIDTIEFPNIVKGEDISGVVTGSGTVFKSIGQESTYSYDISKLYVELTDNILTPYYKQTYPPIFFVELIKLEDFGGGVYVENDSSSMIFYEINNNYTQNPLSHVGNIVNIELTHQQNTHINIGDNWRVKLYKKISDGVHELLEQFDMYNIQQDDTMFTNPYPSSELVCIDRASSNNKFNKTTKTLSFKLLDPELDPSIEYYTSTFSEFDTVRITYMRKTYEYVTIDYTPNPYRPEGEAYALVSILNNKANRMIGLENLIKRITFVPQGLSVQLIIKKGFPLANAIQNVYNILYQYFSYDNKNYNHTIGNAISEMEVKNVINKIALENGIVDVKITTPSYTPDKLTYYFLLDQSIYNQLVTLEQQYTELQNLSSEFKVEVTALPEDVVYVS